MKTLGPKSGSPPVATAVPGVATSPTTVTSDVTAMPTARRRERDLLIDLPIERCGGPFEPSIGAGDLLSDRKKRGRCVSTALPASDAIDQRNFSRTPGFDRD